MRTSICGNRDKRPRKRSRRALLRQRVAGPFSVLAVDDDPDVLALVSRILASAGYRVLEAVGVADALRMAEQTPPHALITDVALRDGDGYRVVEGVRRFQPDLAVVITSGFAQDPARLSRFIDQGVGFVQKPFTPAQLLEALRQALGRAPVGSDASEVKRRISM